MGRYAFESDMFAVHIEFQRNNPSRFIRFDCSKVYKCSYTTPVTAIIIMIVIVLDIDQNGNRRRVHLMLNTMHANKCRWWCAFVYYEPFFLSFFAAFTIAGCITNKGEWEICKGKQNPFLYFIRLR